MQFEEATTRILKILKEQLPAHLHYHSIGHVNDVYEAASRIGQAEGLNETDLRLLLTAVCYHDSGFLKSALEHEKHSCQMAREDLGAFGYSEEQINVICGMIMATRLPQQPANLLEQIICDADLDYLGRPDFFEIGDRLYLELLNSGVVKNDREWNALQVSFLEKHRYFTATSIASRNPQKLAHLNMVKAKLA
jgi:predicted metal-dependent HD superfamily phosphohydrolase